MIDHKGVGVVPGRYAGGAIPIHDGPTLQQIEYERLKVVADGLAGRICAAAADAAKSQGVLVELIGEFDAVGGLKQSRLPPNPAPGGPPPHRLGGGRSHRPR